MAENSGKSEVEETGRCKEREYQGRRAHGRAGK